MRLSVAERIVLQELLPSQGCMVNMLLAKHVREKIEFTSSEIGNFNLEGEEKEDGLTHFKWDRQKEIQVEFHFEDAEMKLLKEQVEKFDSEGKITCQNLDLCLKIKEFTSGAM